MRYITLWLILILGLLTGFSTVTAQNRASANLLKTNLPPISTENANPEKDPELDQLLLATQTIEGDSLKISVWDNLRMQVWKWQNGAWVNQIYGTNSKGFKLFFNTNTMASYYSGNAPTAVSTTKTDDYTIKTVVSRDNVDITQTVSYTNGNTYYDIRWDITNKTGATIDSLRFFAGEDTYFAGSDYGQGYWDLNNNMVYVKNTQGGETGIMGFYGAFSTPPQSYYEGYYGSVNAAVANGVLPNTVNPVNHDAAYALEWKKYSLATNGVWTIYARETFQYVAADDEAPTITLTSPNGGESFTTGSTMSVQFNAADNVAVSKIDVRISTDGGTTYNVISNSVENSSPYTWTIPDSVVSDNCKIKVIAYDAAFNSAEDVSDNVFSITRGTTTATISAEYGPPSAANTWQKFTIPLTAASFGTDATTFNNVLANVTMFRIRTEMHSGADVGSVDAVRIGSGYSSDFSSNNEGWSAAGDGTMEWVSTGGMAGGYIQISDWASGDWHWAVAPISWSGNWTSLSGSNIEFYFKTDQPSSAAVVEIYSGSVAKRIVLSANPVSIPANGTSTVTVTLSDVAPASGLTVSLNSSSSSCVTVPANVTIPAGANNATFTASAVGSSSGCNSVITASASGYGDSRITLTVSDGSSDSATLTGRVTDATTGAGIAGATVVVAGITTTTDSDGNYTIENIPAGVTTANFSGTPRSGTAPLTVQFQDLSGEGYQPISASATDYYPYESSFLLTGGETSNFDMSLSPTILDGDMRIVLNWGARPSDLDLHLKTPSIDGTPHEVYYRDKGSQESAPYAVLDHDDRSSYGPETITIYDLKVGTYKCFIHNYSTSPSITTSGGVVQIYGTSGLLETVNVPTTGDGLYWYICDINGSTGQISVRNTIQSTAPGSDGLGKIALKEPLALETEQVQTITSWQWDFDNDGSIDATDQNPAFTYTSPGNYTVKLTVSDGSENYTSTKTDYITVSPSAVGTLGDYRVTVSSIDITNFPDIKCFVSVVDTSTRLPVAGLTRDHFAVQEDWVSTPVLSVEELTTTSGAQADIVFVFDVTGSMGDEISGLKNRALQFADALAEKGIDYRLGLTTYSDEIEEVHDFTTDAVEFRTWIDGLVASGGGDTKENALEGLARAAVLSYRPSVQKIAILITDADYHEAGESGGGTTSYTTESMISLLNGYGIVTSVVGPDQSQFHQMADETGGLWYNINSDFASIIDDIGRVISSQYVVTYTTPNPTPDNSTRTVGITVSKDSKSGSGFGTYTLTSSSLVSSPANILGINNTTFTIDVNIESVVNLGLCHFYVNFDPTKIEATDVVKGDFLEQGAVTATFDGVRNNTDGKVEITATRFSSAGASGSGTLCTITFKVLVEDCASNIGFEQIRLEEPTEPPTPITVNVLGTHIQAASGSGGVSSILGDFDSDLDIDTRDFALLSKYWKPASIDSGDIGPASGTAPMLTPRPDNIVNFEDLFVFTRMWNWYHDSHRTGSISKPTSAGLEWVISNDLLNSQNVRVELYGNGLDQCAMGHIILKYDASEIKFSSAQAGESLLDKNTTTAFFTENNSRTGLVEISLATLSSGIHSDPDNKSGALAVFEFERLKAFSSSTISLETVDLRTANNKTIPMSTIPELVLSDMGGATPGSYELRQNYPNPFNSSTRLQFLLPEAAHVKIKILNILGQPVRMLVNGTMDSGQHEITWNGKDESGREVMSGIYFVRMESKEFSRTRQVLLIK